jgi:hypothetical protein
MQDTLVMGEGVEKSEFLDINVETSEGFGSILFTDEDPSSADTVIGMGVWFKEFVLICYTKYLLA